LGGGVSNTVLLAETPAGPLVLKQALEKLRVDADWRSRPDRTLREARALLAVAPLLPAGAIPRVEFVDESNFIYAMRAGSEVDWKSELLAGRVEPEVARQAGEILGVMIAGTWMSPEWAREFGDQTVFEELRLDPYYHYTAARFGELAPYFDRLATQCRKRRVSLVHGDWSPKNLLTGGPQVMAIDFEVVHYGDPSFDCGFLFNHLLLKSVHRPAWAERYLECAQTFWLAVSGRVPPEAHWLLPASLEQLGGLLAARVAGKSPAEYLDGPGRAKAWGLAGRILREKPVRLEEIWHWI
jgi:aminoglycoside phosphotransferase (APT) family kinase protein